MAAFNEYVHFTRLLYLFRLTAVWCQGCYPVAFGLQAHSYCDNRLCGGKRKLKFLNTKYKGVLQDLHATLKVTSESEMQFSSKLNS